MLLRFHSFAAAEKSIMQELLAAKGREVQRQSEHYIAR